MEEEQQQRAKGGGKQPGGGRGVGTGGGHGGAGGGGRAGEEEKNKEDEEEKEEEENKEKFTIGQQCASKLYAISDLRHNIKKPHADRMSVYMVLPPYMSLAGSSHRGTSRVVGLIRARWNFLTQKGSWRKFFWITRMLSRQR